ncbi:pyridoxal phosphate-dependent decarboxylase family protein [Vibrio ostreicida]|uniref:Pyridoxal-dependent decarboxylase n=1 Tax=Vibrio ostreicida TaxID=526588 RepID=A0ABT8BTC5_9VIBR|nr:pyridoxal-dependent decarboxylase [Vibrio ostreicida]MDN3610380.1 pyridoxal-dependent decarboxylase [Vibrio ostreicida]NPD07609.1 aspartate aminotransferase family protein [Vibrio ostreicida]
MYYAAILERDGLKANTLSSHYVEKYNDVVSRFFSRDERIWPLFSSPELSMLSRRTSPFSPQEKASLERALSERVDIPERMSEPTQAFDPLALFAAHQCKDWQDPRSVENVISTPCDPAIHGAMLATLKNPNLVYSEYAGMAVELERLVVRQIANLAGYNPKTAGGIFTQGGTFCNLYGYLFGLRKTFPTSKLDGVAGKKFCMINSESGHYSNMTNLSLLGIDINNQVIRVKINANNQICVLDLERRLKECFHQRISVPTIMLTCGTTDTFAIDDIVKVRQITQRLCRQYGVRRAPHIHVDAAVGWSLMFFNDYDLERNPLAINSATLKSVDYLKKMIAGLQAADSFTVDFQKWGYSPYTSSLLMVKDGRDFDALSQDASYFSYFDSQLKQETHLQSTIECSRGAVGVFSAYSAMQFMGKEGYQVVMAHGLQNANYLRMRMQQIPTCHVVGADNHGPAVAMRLYPRECGSGLHTYQRERDVKHSDKEVDELIKNTVFHRNHFLNRRGRGLNTNWVESIAHTEYDSLGHCLTLPGEKAVFLNPYTSREHIDEYCRLFR